MRIAHVASTDPVARDSARLGVCIVKKMTAGLLALSMASGAALAGSNPVDGSCRFKGKELFGDIQIVDSFPDVKIQIVTSFPDLKVQLVESFADACGQWRMVESFPDVKVQIVSSFPDVKVQYVESFPGLP
jgi:hypothetical protein